MVGSAGDDATMLAVGEALEAILPITPPPPSQPTCQGCGHKVAVRDPELKQVSEIDSRKKAHLAAQELSIYSFTLEGSCSLLKQQQSVREEL